MSMLPEGHVFALVVAFFVGLALGLLYDLLRPFRLHAPTWVEFLLDLLYWFIVTITVFVCAPLLSDGHVRFVILANNLIGAVVYFKLLSHPIRWLTGFLDRCCTKVLWLVFWPFRRLLTLVSKPLLLFLSHFKKTMKKFFSFSYRWFTISKIPKKATSNVGQSSKSEGGPQYVQNKKGWSSD